jgi:hypothetical protein
MRVPNVTERATSHLLTGFLAGDGDGDGDGDMRSP